MNLNTLLNRISVTLGGGVAWVVAAAAKPGKRMN